MSPTHRFQFTPKTIVITSVILVILAGLVVTWLLIQSSASNKQSQEKVVDTPSFQTLSPNGKSVTNNLGGWTRISPAEAAPVYTYTDKIEGTPITVSQQELPPAFKSNLDTQVAELAKKFNATTTVDAGNTKVYIGTSAKGPQSVIFAKNNLLILIKSDKKIENENWTKYVQSLANN